MFPSLVIIILVQIAVGEDLSKCPMNLQRDEYLRVHNDRCYQFVIHHHATWHKAVNECGSKGGTLVTVRNADDQHFLMSALGHYHFRSQGIWIGLSDEQREGAFKWTSGEPVTYTDWALGQPGVIRGRRFLLDTLLSPITPEEDCVLLKYTDSGHWHDYPCSNLLLLPENYPYVCEFTLSQQPTTTSVPTQAPPTPKPSIFVDSGFGTDPPPTTFVVETVSETAQPPTTTTLDPDFETDQPPTTFAAETQSQSMIIG